MALYLVHSADRAASRNASGVEGAIVTAADAAGARTAAAALVTFGSGPDFADETKFAVTLLATDEAGNALGDVLIEGTVIDGPVRRRGA